MIAPAIALVSLLLLVCGVVLDPSAEQGFILLIAPPFALVGALIASRRAQNPIGWLFLAFGLSGAIVFAAYSYAYRTLVTHPGSLPGGDVAASIAGHLWHPGFGFLVFALLLFPNGHLLSRRWRWVAAVALVDYAGMAVAGIFDSSYTVSELGLPAQPLFTGTVDEVGSAIFNGLLFFNLIMLVVAGISLVFRLRRSHGEERQQVKWFIYAVAFVMFAFPTLLFATGVANGVFLFPLIPIAAAIAILKYRLYDIDVVINRTLVYGTLTALLGGAYLACVLVLQLVLSPSSDLAIAVSTLAVAALFRPARIRIQALVDRRFYRSSYDAARTVERFGAHLRDEVSLEALSDELRAVVAQTMQPAHVSVWLKGPSQ